MGKQKSNLDALLERKGWSRKQLAFEVGVSIPTVCEWCNQKKRPSGENLKKICRALGESADHVLGILPLPDPNGCAKGFGSRLKAVRELRRKESSEAAEALSVSVGILDEWEADISTPSLEMLARLCSLLSVSADYLLGLTDDPQRGIIKSPAELADDDVVAVQKTNADALTPEEIEAVRAMLGRGRSE